MSCIGHHINDTNCPACRNGFDVFVWRCIGCGCRIMTHVDFHINARPICVECNAEMEPVEEDPNAPSGDIERMVQELRRSEAQV